MQQVPRRSLLLVLLIATLFGVPAFGQAKTAPKEIKPRKNVKAPAKFRALFETTKGKFVVEVTREWAPNGADRFFDAVQQGFYDGCGFFRVLPDFVVQFGINGNPKTQRHWSQANIKDDPAKKSNLPGTVAFAKGGPNSRTTQLFISYGDNSRLDALGFPPFGKVVEGMEFVRQINSQYGQRPNQNFIKAEGTPYLKRVFPKLDYIKKASILPDGSAKKKE